MAEAQTRTGIKMAQAAAKNIRVMSPGAKREPETQHVAKPRLQGAAVTKEPTNER